MTKEDDRTLLNLHSSTIGQPMLLVYMSTWFDDTSDDGAGGDVPARVPTQNLSCGVATLADAGPIRLHLQNHLAAGECARSSTMTCATQLYYDVFPFPGIIGGDKFDDANDEPKLRGADAAPNLLELYGI